MNKKADASIDWRNVASTPSGRKIIWRILELCGTFSSPFSVDTARTTDYFCGRQSIGLDIIGELEQADPYLFPRLITDNLENKNDNSSDSTDGDAA